MSETRTQKIFALIMLLFVNLVILAGLKAVADERGGVDQLIDRLNDGDGPVMVIAHRACWTEGAPENSLAAIDACIAMGVDMIEIDVRLTADGVPVLQHDKSLKRMTGSDLRVKDISYNKLQKFFLRAGKGGQGAANSDQQIPTLRQALKHAKNKILINLDVKTKKAMSEAVALTKELGMEKQILLKERRRPYDRELQGAAFHGKIPFMPIIGQCEPSKPGKICAPFLNEAIAGFLQYNPPAFEVVFQEIAYLQRGVGAIKASGKRLWVNTLSPRLAAGIVDADATKDPQRTWGRLIWLGANMIQTDHPKELISYLRGQGLR